jgi:hypothetical protein
MIKVKFISSTIDNGDALTYLLDQTLTAIGKTIEEVRVLTASSSRSKGLLLVYEE